MLLWNLHYHIRQHTLLNKAKKKQAATMAVVYLHRIVLAYIVAK